MNTGPANQPTAAPKSGLSQQIQGLLQETLQDKQKLLWISLDLTFYLLFAIFGNCPYYSVLVTACFELFLIFHIHQSDSLELFHSIPKIFLLDFSTPILLTLTAFALIGYHIYQFKENAKCYFILAVASAIHMARFLDSSTSSCILATIVLAFGMNLWERTSNSPSNSRNDISSLKNSAIPPESNMAVAEDLILKLKKLKFRMILENESPTNQTKQNQRPDQQNKSKSFTANAVSFKNNINKSQEPKNRENHSLDVEDIKTLIELLLAHNQNNLKYWIPQKVRSVLNNEEVSAYLLAYLNTQDVLESPRHFKGKKTHFITNPEFFKSKRLESIGEDYNFDVFSFDRETFHQDSMRIACQALYDKFGVQHSLLIDNETMAAFLTKIQNFYFNNYYHNSLHGTDVTNSVAFFLNCGLKECFSDFEIASLLISSSVHDVGHPGFNNSFMKTLKTKQAIIYNDQSVLENYHCYLTFQTIQSEKYNILKNLTVQDQAYFRKILVSTVLDTDLAKHFIILPKFETSIQEEFPMTDEKNRLLSMAMALKCGDIGHSAKSLDLHKIWSRRVSEEFWHQGDREIEFGIDLTQLCDRKNNIAKSQDGFIDFFALPLFNSFAKFLRSEKFDSICLKQLDNNKQYWNDEMKREEEQGPEALTFMKDTDKAIKNIKVSDLNLKDLFINPRV